MPEMHVRVQWPDGSRQSCYSPSLVMEDFFEPGTAYPLGEFVERSREALTIASARVQEKYGFPCSMAAASLATIERRAAGFADVEAALVTVEGFEH